MIEQWSTLPVAILDADAVRRARVAQTVRKMGGLILTKGDPENPRLVLGAVNNAEMDESPAPILLYGVDPGTASSGIAGFLPAPEQGDAFRETLRPWLDVSNAVLMRLTSVFGGDEIADLAARLRQQLTIVDASGVMVSRKDAHRLAGFAGTLGFRRLSACAEQWSRGNDSVAASLIGEAALAEKVLARHLANHSYRSTKV